jgi:hypothetical protein
VTEHYVEVAKQDGIWVKIPEQITRDQILDGIYPELDLSLQAVYDDGELTVATELDCDHISLETDHRYDGLWLQLPPELDWANQLVVSQSGLEFASGTLN